jgi:hypothetical protein
MAAIPFYDQFQAVSEWCDGEGIAAGFPTCEQTATADPYIFNHIVVLLRNNDVALSNPTAGQLGVDPYSVALTPGRWREAFTSANAYAHNQNFFHGFPTFQRMEGPDGPRFVVVLIRSTGPRPAGNGVTWRDIPAEEVFPEVPPGASSFLSLPPETWMQRLNAWAIGHNQGAALPTGWTANYGGKWFVGTVLFEDSTVPSRVQLSGTELGYYQELCAQQAQWQEPTTTGSVRVIASSDSVAYPAPLAVDEAPFGDPIYAEPGKVDYLRCVAQRIDGAVIAILARGPDAVRLEMRPRQDNRRFVYFGNRTDFGAWIVAHRFNFDTQEGEGEVISYHRRPGEPEQFAFELTTGPPGLGQIQAHTVGFVKQGILGIALPIMSFAYSTFIRLSTGMDLWFSWVLP